MAGKGWLALNDYANKHRVSVSTLRRRIKANTVESLFEQGKYWLSDKPLRDHNPEFSIEPVGVAPPQNEVNEMVPKTNPSFSNRSQDTGDRPPTPSNDENQGPLFSTANKLLNELKKAYMQILQEKEEQILILKSEISDLATLVRVLESENDRLKAVNKNSSQNSEEELLKQKLALSNNLAAKEAEALVDTPAFEIMPNSSWLDL